MKAFYTLLLLCFAICFSEAQTQPGADVFECYNGRYIEPIFNQIESIRNIPYARKQKSNGAWQTLVYDVYMPKNDEDRNRVAVFLAHGGGYIDLLDQHSPDIIRIARHLVALGYVVFSVEYREEPSFNSILSEKKMVKAMGRALIDIRDATCHLMDTTIMHDNPYGVNYDKVIIGGVSAGAVSFLHAVFLDQVEWIPEQYREWILEVEPNTQALLDNKYCGANVIGMINISGAILDTSWIQAERVDQYPPMMHVHGTADPIVPYGIDRPFGMDHLPILMGSEPIHQKLQSIGVRSELDTWVGAGHVPFLGLDISQIFGATPLDFIFEPSILNPTLDHITGFAYSLIDCDEIDTETLTAINDQQATSIKIYPNPSSGYFKLNIPNGYQHQMGTINIINSVGKSIHQSKVFNTSSYYFEKDINPGIYTIHISYEEADSKQRFVSQLIVVE